MERHNIESHGPHIKNAYYKYLHSKMYNNKFEMLEIDIIPPCTSNILPDGNYGPSQGEST